MHTRRECIRKVGVKAWILQFKSLRPNNDIVRKKSGIFFFFKSTERQGIKIRKMDVNLGPLQ